MADKAVIAIKGVWKIFGDRAEEAMEAIKSRGLSKGQVLEEFGCVVGIADCSFSVNRGEVFCVMGLSAAGAVQTDHQENLDCYPRREGGRESGNHLSR